MKIILYEDRTIEKCGDVGTQNENNVTDIEIIVPKQYEDYNKKIVFETTDGVVWDFIEDDHYKIRKNISKYESVDCYIWLTKNDEDFRSETTHLTFNRNQDANEALTEEDMDGFNKMLITLDSQITKVSDKEQEVKDLVDDIRYMLENGEFKGDTPVKGIDYFTNEEKEEFKSAVVKDSKEEIKTTVIEDSKKELNSHIEDKKTEIDNYTTEQEKSLKTELDKHTNTKKTELEKEMSNTKNSLVQEFNTNATDKTNAFNENYNEKLNSLNGAVGGDLEPRVKTLEEDRVNCISSFEIEGESKQDEEPDFLENKEVTLQIIKDNITINVSNGVDIKSFIFPLQKPLIGNFNFTDLEKDVLDLLSEKEVHHWNYMNVAASQQNWLTRTIPQINAYTLYIALPYIKNHSKAVSNLFRNGGALETKYVFWIQIRGEFSIVTNPLDFGTLDSMTSEEAIAKWKEMLAGKNLELAYYYMYSEENHYIEELQFTEEQKTIARQIKDLITYEGYTNVSINHELNPTMTLNYAKSNKQAIENLQKQVNEIINLLSTSTTSAMLIDNMQTDLEKEVL